MEKWIRDSVTSIMGSGFEEVAQWLNKNVDNEKELNEHLSGMLNLEDARHRQFLDDFNKRRAAIHGAAGGKKSNNSSNNNGNGGQRAGQRQNDKKKGKFREKENNAPASEPPRPVEKAEKKKTKFVNLYSQEGKDRQTVLLKGRIKCDCEARTHGLINNCLSCGRIVCEQEGAGPCLFCDAMVCTPDQQALLSSNTKQGDSLYNKLKGRKPVKIADDAVKHRDKLLEYDRNSSRRTEVIDDECDYYQSSNSVWLSIEEREKMQKREDEMRAKKHESRLTRKVTIDLASGEAVEAPEDDGDSFDALNAEFRESADSMIARVRDDSNVCPTIDFDRPCFVETNITNARNIGRPKVDNRTNYHNKIQDKEFLEMMDEGVCLSLHQPYASLLVAGIKTHEGRGWYSSHRGRLWIAAAAAIPDKETISMLENRYKLLLNENLKFPQNYPTGCLLGCVTVTDVLPNDEYRRLYPQGDSDSPFVFICHDCHELPLKFPMQGKHKIYKLDKKIHQAASKCLEQLLKNRSS